MTGLVAVLVGAALCFAGVASIHLAVLLSGFGVCWMLADLLGASTSAALLIGLVGAVVGWIIVSLVFRAALFFVGAVVGAVIGAKLYSALDTDRNVAIALIFTVGFAFLSGWLANRWRVRMLLFLTAIGGAGIVLNGLGRAVHSLDWMRRPTSAAEQVLDIVLWAGLAVLGWATQRQVSARALERDRARK